jgi:hypothetical protein
MTYFLLHNLHAVQVRTLMLKHRGFLFFKSKTFIKKKGRRVRVVFYFLPSECLKALLLDIRKAENKKTR